MFRTVRTVTVLQRTELWLLLICWWFFRIRVSRLKSTGPERVNCFVWKGTAKHRGVSPLRDQLYPILLSFPYTLVASCWHGFLLGWRPGSFKERLYIDRFSGVISAPGRLQLLKCSWKSYVSFCIVPHFPSHSIMGNGQRCVRSVFNSLTVLFTFVYLLACGPKYPFVYWNKKVHMGDVRDWDLPCIFHGPADIW